MEEKKKYRYSDATMLEMTKRHMEKNRKFLKMMIIVCLVAASLIVSFSLGVVLMTFDGETLTDKRISGEINETVYEYLQIQTLHSDYVLIAGMLLGISLGVLLVWTAYPDKEETEFIVEHLKP